ncbi:MAG: hypothetical protein LBD92_07725, partial [Oscillospiraceae bacterium]|nr:hypothetical protein [Oscillospiraceae bacterium]
MKGRFWVGTQKTRKSLAILLSLAIIFSMLSGLTINASAADYTMTYVWNGGSKPNVPASGDTVSISSTAEMGYFEDYVNDVSAYNTTGVTFYLTQSVKLSGAWTPVGVATISTDPATSSPLASGAGFAGTFDGRSFTVFGLSVNLNVSGLGLFKYVTRAGTVRDVTVLGEVTTTGRNDAIAGVVGYNDGTVCNVTSYVTVAAGSAYNVGGIVGFNNGQFDNTGGATYSAPVGVIVNSVNHGSVTGYNKTGGITGENAGVISFCANYGDITGTNASRSGIGGIAGRNGNNNVALEIGWITNCYNRGQIDVGNGSWGGGIVGFQNSISYADNCYDTGAVVNGYQYYNTVIGSNENTSAVPPTRVNYAENPAGSSTLDSELGVKPVYSDGSDMPLDSDDFLNLLESRAIPDGYWARGGCVNAGYPFHLRTAPVPDPTGGNVQNDYSVIYISSGGDDANEGDTPETAVATLARAVQQAGRSTVSGVYIGVLDTITVSDEEYAYGNRIPVRPASSFTSSTMFIVASGGDLTVGGLAFDGSGAAGTVTIVFDVQSGGELTLRNNAAISNAAYAVNVQSGGGLSLNQSDIGGTTSVKLADSSSSFDIFTSPTQTFTISGVIDLGDGGFISFRSAPASATGSLTVTMANPDV